MIFESKKVTLKNGKEAVLRSVEPTDAATLIEFLRTVSGETPFLLRYAEEVTFTIEAEEALLTEKRNAPRDLMMAAVVDGEIVGCCGISARGELRRLRHRCGFAIAIKKEFWGLGLGSMMITYICSIAKNLDFEQIELEVVEGNDRAKELYLRHGFRSTGTNYRALKYDDGIYRDETVMVKVL